MLAKFLLVTFVVFLQQNAVSAQRQWVMPTTSAAEMRNPYTWYWPYAIAASEAYRDYFTNAQQITNQLYTQAYITQAFPWSQPGQGGQGGQRGQRKNNGTYTGVGYQRYGYPYPGYGYYNYGRPRTYGYWG